jgi:hypothetical protein
VSTAVDHYYPAKLAARDDIARSISTVKGSHNRRRFVLETATLNWFLRDVEGRQEERNSREEG